MERLQLAHDAVHEKASLRRVLGAFATGVTVVTAGGDLPHGMTANSFTSVSLDPPLILVCVGRDAFMHEVLTQQTAFAVSMLKALTRVSLLRGAGRPGPSWPPQPRGWQGQHRIRRAVWAQELAVEEQQRVVTGSAPQ